MTALPMRVLGAHRVMSTFALREFRNLVAGELVVPSSRLGRPSADARSSRRKQGRCRTGFQPRSAVSARGLAAGF